MHPTCPSYFTPPVPAAGQSLRPFRARAGWLLGWCIAVLAPASMHAAGERINQEGRILGPAPTVAAPILFNTPQADAVVAAMQIMPVTSPWNEDVSRLPLLANSAAMIARIMADLPSSRRTLRPFYEMNYALVPDNQPKVAIPFFNYPDESDPSPYPIPDDLPVEGWPRETAPLTLLQWQQNIDNSSSDRHAIMVMPGAGFIWETWLTQLTSAGWKASNGAKFDLKSNALRPASWTSGDAAGLPMFPALVRYDECERGMVEHALRLVVNRTRVGPIYPATHQASAGNTTDPAIPAMGQRLRLKTGFVIPNAWTKEEKAVLLALKKYGALVADNGGFFSVSVCPDDRFAETAFDHLSMVGIDNFEVVQSTSATGGPRSAGAPVANAGPDLAATTNTTTALNGTVTTPAGVPTTIAWKQSAGPGTVTFTDATQAGTRATFSKAGSYTLLLSAADGVHAVAYDALVVTVADAREGGGGTPAPLPVVSVINSIPKVTLGSGQVGKFTLTLGSPLRGDLFVSYALSGSAGNGIDYQLLKGTKKIRAGRSQASIKITPRGDLEGASKKIVKLALTPDDHYTIGTTKPVRVRIYAGE